MSEKDGGTNMVMIVLYLYLITSQVMTLYYWWPWAQDHGFWSSIFIGPIVGEIKGLLWIFFIW